MTEKKKIATLQEIIQHLLELMGVEAKTEVSKQESDIFQVQLEAEDPGILIGYHGETLAAIQLLLGMIAYRQTGEWIRVLVNVGDYREKRQESLERMAQSAAEKVKFSSEEQALPEMNATDRRLVHLALANDPEVATESEGEGRNRRVVIKPAS